MINDNETWEAVIRNIVPSIKCQTERYIFEINIK